MYTVEVGLQFKIFATVFLNYVYTFIKYFVVTLLITISIIFLAILKILFPLVTKLDLPIINLILRAQVPMVATQSYHT